MVSANRFTCRPLRRCPSSRCLACLLPSPRPWLPPASVGSSLSHTSCCLRWSPEPLEGESLCTFSGKQQHKVTFNEDKNPLHIGTCCLFLHFFLVERKRKKFRDIHIMTISSLHESILVYILFIIFTVIWKKTKTKIYIFNA